MIEVDVTNLSGETWLAREAAHPLQRSSQEVWRRCSCRCVKIYPGIRSHLNTIAKTRAERDYAQRSFCDCAASWAGGLGQGKLYVHHWSGKVVVPTDDLSVDWHARALHAPVVALSAVNDHAEHAQRRRTWTRGFSPVVLKDYEEIVKERVVQLTETLSARKSVDLARLFAFFA